MSAVFVTIFVRLEMLYKFTKNETIVFKIFPCKISLFIEHPESMCLCIVTLKLRYKKNVFDLNKLLFLYLLLFCLDFNAEMINSKIVHDPPYWRCSDCEYNSTHKATLKRHIESKHLEFSYQCNICNHVLSSKHLYSVHMKKHFL